MKTEDLQFKGCDPGAVKFGNFINYYSFHSAKQRVSSLDTQMFPAMAANETIICLDVGCNTGELTKELSQFLNTIYPKSDVHFLAIDIDPNLIQRAKESSDYTNISYETLNITNQADCEGIQKYLKSHGKNMFDIIFCFSITMWIHLNNGDDGLMNFLQYIKSIAKTIVIEPQPWNCYRNAQRRVKKSGDTFPFYETLKIRSNVDTMIENTLADGHKKVYESQRSSWNRKILSYIIECKLY